MDQDGEEQRTSLGLLLLRIGLGLMFVALSLVVIGAGRCRLARLFGMRQKSS